MPSSQDEVIVKIGLNNKKDPLYEEKIKVSKELGLKKQHVFHVKPDLELPETVELLNYARIVNFKGNEKELNDIKETIKKDLDRRDPQNILISPQNEKAAWY